MGVHTVPCAPEAPEHPEDGEGEEERDQGQDQEHEGHHVHGVVKLDVLEIHASGVIGPAPKYVILYSGLNFQSNSLLHSLCWKIFK